MPVVTSLYAALAALLLLVLAMRVVQARWRARVGLGDGGDRDLGCRIRAHANASEYLPIALLLLLLLEVGGTAAVVLHVFGVLLLVARVLHAFGLSRSPNTSPGRMLGAGLTFLLLLVMAGLLLGMTLQRLW